MTADWKKKPLDKAKPRDNLKEAHAANKELMRKLDALKHDLNWTKGVVESVRKERDEYRVQRDNYLYLRNIGVLVEVEGEFKYLQDENLDTFLNERLAIPSRSWSGPVVKMEGAPVGTRMILPQTLVNEARALLEKSISETLIYNTKNRYNLDYGSNS